MSVADLRPAYRRLAARQLLEAILAEGRATCDAVLVEDWPPELDRRLVGEAVVELLDNGMLHHAGEYRKSSRPWAKQNPKRIWRATDRRAARDWLAAHPPLTAPPNRGLFDDLD